MLSWSFGECSLRALTNALLELWRMLSWSFDEWVKHSGSLRALWRMSETLGLSWKFDECSLGALVNALLELWWMLSWSFGECSPGALTNEWNTRAHLERCDEWVKHSSSLRALEWMGVKHSCSLGAFTNAHLELWGMVSWSSVECSLGALSNALLELLHCRCRLHDLLSLLMNCWFWLWA